MKSNEKNDEDEPSIEDDDKATSNTIGCLVLIIVFLGIWAGFATGVAITALN